MDIRFWGTRGSIPVALTSHDIRDKVVDALLKAGGRRFANAEEANRFAGEELGFATTHTFGGHTPCVELIPGGTEYYVCDMGSGARPFGSHVLARQAGEPAVINIFMSHVHWDHIMGFPFLGPAYVPGMKIRIHGCHEVLEHAFRLQQSPPCFPVAFTQLNADVEFITLKPGVATRVGAVTVTPRLQLHAGDSYGYRFEAGGKTVVYSTDSEHRLEDTEETARIAAFFADADAVIFDAMYSLAEAVSVKEDWGHSSNMVGVELCQMAKAKRLLLFHHEPANDDATLERLLHETRRFEELTRSGHRVAVESAYDGLEVRL